MERVQKALQKEFSSKELLLQNAGGGMVGGWIISDSFEELTVEERQQKVWKLFEAFLNKQDRNRIVGFHTFTPLEKKLAFEDDDIDDLTVSSKKTKKPIATRGNGVMRRKSKGKSRLA
jgi:hypothetical protein